MAVIVQQTLPADVPIQMLDAVAEEMGVDSDPPTGLIVHTHYEKDGRVHILDVWDSIESHDSFGQSRLGPAMGKVAAARGFDLSQAEAPPAPTVTDVHRLVRGN